MFLHDYPFDPCHGHDLDALLAVAAPEEPEDFALFWRDLHAQARQIAVAPMVREIASPQPRIQVFEVAFTSVDGVRIGGWLTRPRDQPIERGVIVGHGYGGREGPDFHLPFKRAALLFPCARGISRSARPDFSSNPLRHVLHGIRQRETYILGGCAADTVWCAASALLELFPMAARRLEYLGISFGGGVGALALPWDERFHRAHLNVPSFGHHPLRLNCPCVGSGEAVRAYQRQTGRALETLRYFDAAVAARHLRIPMHVAAARFDPAVPPPGQFAIYNALAGHRELFMLQAGHFDHPGLAAEDARLRDALAYFFNC
ncbi:MAG: acetylxylan esterase [Candidatus Contendobacter sp.]|nr:acetylxylan esterase [Candidatus Contendobacter sp.]MDS4058603.1 acetylxylan esterase [Candidatus Contendobacter sp.]